MLSRIFWIGLAGIALVAGIALQDGDRLFGRTGHDDISWDKHAIEQRVDRAIDRSFDKMEVTTSDGEEIDVPAHTRRAMAHAVSELVKAETDLAMARVGDSSDGEVRAAQARRDRAHDEVERLKTEIEGIEKAAQGDDDAMRAQIQREVREDVRDAVRDAVRN